MRRRVGGIVLVAAIVAVVAVVGLRSVDRLEQQGPISYSARSFEGDRVVSTSALRGRPALLTSWASWCTECRVELPQLERYWKSHKNDGLRVVAVNLDTSGGVGPAARTAAEFGLTMPLWSDEDNRFTSVFGGVGVPMSVLFNRSGGVERIWQGPIDFEDPDAIAPITRLLGETQRSSGNQGAPQVEER